MTVAKELTNALVIAIIALGELCNPGQ